MEKTLKDFINTLEERFSKLEKHLEAVATENADLRERLFDLERSESGFIDPADCNRPDVEDEQ